MMANLFFFGVLWVIAIFAILSDSSQSFKPKLQWICIPSGIKLTIITDEPFNGILNTVGHRSNCSSNGHGQTNTSMVIDFDDGDKCGVKYENQTGTYWVEVEVHQHKVLVFEHDGIFNVSCKNSTMSYDPYFGFSLDLFPYPINNSPTAIDQSTNADYGQNYVLNALIEPSDDSIKYRNLFQMTNCFVEGDQQNAMEIIDSNGCSTDLKLISDVEYDYGNARVNLSSDYPFLKFTMFKCKFSICDKYETCRQSCQRHWYDTALKKAKSFAYWIGFNTASANDDSQRPSPSPAIIDPFISNNDKLDYRRDTIVQILVPPKSSQTNFIQKCHKINEIYWLYVIIVVEWIFLFWLILLIFY